MVNEHIQLCCPDGIFGLFLGRLYGGTPSLSTIRGYDYGTSVVDALINQSALAIYHFNI